KGTCLFLNSLPGVQDVTCLRRQETRDGMPCMDGCMQQAAGAVAAPSLSLRGGDSGAAESRQAAPGTTTCTGLTDWPRRPSAAAAARPTGNWTRYLREQVSARQRWKAPAVDGKTDLSPPHLTSP